MQIFKPLMSGLVRSSGPSGRYFSRSSVLNPRIWGHKSRVTDSSLIKGSDPRVASSLTAKYQPAFHQIQQTRDFQNSRPMRAFEDGETKALTIWSNLKDVKSSPVPALTLGLSGLIPFVAMPTYMIAQGYFCPEIAYAQVAYGASILSFLGGVRWGFTIPEENPVRPDWVNLGYSVIPSLIAWTGLMLPTPYSLLTVMGGLTLAGYLDMAMYGYPGWFKGLRFTLSFVAILSLWTTFMCGFLMKEKTADKSVNDKPASGGNRNNGNFEASGLTRK